MNLVKASAIEMVFSYKVTLPGTLYVSVLNAAIMICSLVEILLARFHVMPHH